MLTRDRLKKKVTEWCDKNGVNASNDAINMLCEYLENEIVEIAREAHQRGIEGKVF